MSKQPARYYHAIAVENLESALQEGLRPSSTFHATGRTIRPAVFLATSPYWAAMYGGTDSIVLEVSVRDSSLLRRSHLGDPSHERLYYGWVSPEDLSVLDDAEEYLS